MSLAKEVLDQFSEGLFSDTAEIVKIIKAALQKYDKDIEITKVSNNKIKVVLSDDKSAFISVQSL